MPRDRARQAPLPRLHATHPRHVPLTLAYALASGGKAGVSSIGNPATAGQPRRFSLVPSAVRRTLPRPRARSCGTCRRPRRTPPPPHRLRLPRAMLEPALDGIPSATPTTSSPAWNGPAPSAACHYVDGISGSQFAPVLRPANRRRSITKCHLALHARPRQHLELKPSTRWISDTGLAARVPAHPGSWIALVDGHPVLAVVSWGQRIIPLPAPENQQQLALATIATIFPRLPRRTPPFMQIRHWDQQEILSSPAEESLRNQGFMRDPQGLRLYRQYVVT